MKQASKYSCSRPCVAFLALIVFAMLYISRQQTIGELDPTPQEKVQVDTNPAFGDSSSKKRNPIRQISILGERNSGTRWTFEYVCFARTMLLEYEF